MPSWNVVDEAIIDADPSEVFKALLDEYTGVSRWWMPFLEIKLRGGEKTLQKGAVFDITVPDRYRGKTKLVGKITDIIESKLIKYDLEGDYLGNAEWTLEPLDGKTRLRFRWNTKSNRFLITLVSPFINIARGHSRVMELGFKGLNNYLSQR